MGRRDSYTRMYRWGFTPWERYARVARDGIAARLDREEAERSDPPGRALDLGCGRGRYTAELARRGWEAVGVDFVPAAIADARRAAPPGATYQVADVTALPAAELGSFDFFLDIGCFQGFDAPQRRAFGRGVAELAAPGATLLMLEFGPGPLRSLLGGVSRTEIETAFPAWELFATEPADTAGLGFPMNTTRPRWYRLRHLG